jgi:sugar (pentulose or hexulose) kinase
MKSIIAIDISSTNVKVGLVSTTGLILEKSSIGYVALNDGEFGKRFDFDDMWSKIHLGLKKVTEFAKSHNHEIIAISSDAQRIAIVFLDENNEPVYGGPNKDTRGVDSQWVIDSEYEGEEGERQLFNITAHCPPLVFGLARLIWFREEDSDSYDRIKKICLLDDWIQLRLSNVLVSEPSIASDSQFFDVGQRTWSNEIIEKFGLDPDLFPKLVEAATIVGNLSSNLAEELGLKGKIPVIRSGPDTQITLLGMGCIKEGQMGVPLGTSAPLMLLTNKCIIDPKLNMWTDCYPIPNKWVIEGNSGMTGMVYDWFKNNVLMAISANTDELVEKYISETKPGANLSFAFLGPELMNFKNQTDIKPSVFVFPSQSTISDYVTDRKTLTRAVLENIGFGIYENYIAIKELAPNNKISEVFCGGGMANSEGFIKIIADTIGQDINVPAVKDSAYIGQLIICTVALGLYKNHEEAVKGLIKQKTIKFDPKNHAEYLKFYQQWKNYKEKLGKL